MRSNADELDLVRKSLGGDAEAFAAIVEKYQQRVYNVAFRMTGDREDSLDLTQESFVRVFRALKSFKGDSSLGTWIHRIVNNVVIDELRKRQRRPKVALNTDALLTTDEGEHALEISGKREDTPEEQLLRMERIAEIEQALAMITSEHRLVLIMRDIEGLSYEEMAQILALNIGTVKSRLSRARIALREKLIVAEQGKPTERLKVQRGG
ncbi:MAG: ECF RNA polymerase sigma factor SigE [Firmicutes bacterium]|nr:ECF RNA polymerase sigma factor SigE [Bacillota bacterium]MBT9157218.1 ECF RNA polymerase sigma factor SigE [Bacillota bacterium]